MDISHAYFSIARNMFFELLKMKPKVILKSDFSQLDVLPLPKSETVCCIFSRCTEGKFQSILVSSSSNGLFPEVK